MCSTLVPRNATCASLRGREGMHDRLTPSTANTTWRTGARRQGLLLRRRITVPIRAAASETTTVSETVWFQKQIKLPSFKRGCHVITHQLVSGLSDIKDIRMGLVNFFILHTSASLTINENASPDVPLDLNDSLDRIVPEGRFYRHDEEGSDDMPAHVKSSLMGPSLTVPIVNGRLALGIWQGIYLNEHRNYGGSRNVIATIQGQKNN